MTPLKGVHITAVIYEMLHYDYLAYAVHQPCGLIEPSTTWQVPSAVGVLPGTNNLQLLHFWSPFGLSWYFMAVLVDFAASALPVKADASATPVTTTAPLSSAARNFFVQNSVHFWIPFLICPYALTSSGLPTNSAPATAELNSLYKSNIAWENSAVNAMDHRVPQFF